jgi:hypothetical protein
MADFETTEERLLTRRPRSKIISFLVRDWPYLLMLALALMGAAYTGIAQAASTAYWMALAPLFGIITVAAHWRDVEGAELHWQLIRTQGLHWIAVMFAMYLVFVADVQHMMSSVASGLMVLAILALGTFTAGIHSANWRITLVGVILGLAVPAIAWLAKSSLLILIIAVVLVTFAVLLFTHRPPPIPGLAEGLEEEDVRRKPSS